MCVCVCVSHTYFTEEDEGSHRVAAAGTTAVRGDEREREREHGAY